MPHQAISPSSTLLRQPSLSGVAHRLMEAPVWLPSKDAERMSAVSWSNGKWTMEQTNNLPTAEAENARRSRLPADAPHKAPVRADRWPGGLLRHVDLDVFLALNHLWAMAGFPADGVIDLTLPDVLRWMGYESLAGAPYPILRASLQRLASVDIAIYDQTEADDPLSIVKNRTRLVAHWDYHAAPYRGAIATGRIRLSEVSMAWMQQAHQVIDLDVVAHLVRDPATRRMSLARVLYVAIARWRNAKGEVDMPEGWLAEKYGDRIPADPMSGTLGTLRYKDAFTRRSCLARALTGLGKAKVLGLSRNQIIRRFTGFYQCPANMPRLRDQPRQTRLAAFSTMNLLGLAPDSEPPRIEHQVEKPLESKVPWWLPCIPGLTAANALAAMESSGMGDRDGEALAIWVWWSQGKGIDGAGDATAAQRWMTRAKAGREAWNQDAVRRMIAATNHYADGDALKQAAREMRAAVQPR